MRFSFFSELSFLFFIKVFNLDDITNKNNNKFNGKWSYIPDHLYRILIIGGSASGKINSLLNLIKEQDDTDKIYLHTKDLSEPKYQFLIEKHKNAGIIHLNDQKAFIESSNSMDNVYEDIDDYNPTRIRRIF